MTLTTRRITLQFQLGLGTFGEDGNDTVELSGLRCSVNITKSGGESMSSAQLRVFGMPLEVMNQLTVLKLSAKYTGRNNTVTVLAGDDETGLAVCFQGIISEAWADIRSAPEAAFHVIAQTGVVDSLRPVPPTSYRGTVDVATAMAGIAAQMRPPRTLENSGVTTRINDPYLAGDLLTQARKLAQAADINCVLDDGDVLAIWPKGATRAGQSLIVSKDTGLVGYPAFTGFGVQLAVLYNPNITFGRPITVVSDLEPANGDWNVASLSHNLDCEVPGGDWYTRIECSAIDQPAPVIAAPGR